MTTFADGPSNVDWDGVWAKLLDTKDPAPAELTALQRIEAEEYDTFWSKRDFLTFTHRLAKSKMKNPWGMLMINLTRIVSSVDPWVVLPETATSSYGSLNLFTVLYGASGAGKSTAVDISRQYLQIGDPAKIYPMPSGEGLVEIFVNRQGSLTERRALVVIDEAGAMAEAAKRKGSTIMGVLREMWAGVDTGQQNADASRRRRLERHSYRLCFLLGMQERLSTFLINDAQLNYGTPQRFIWAQIKDPTVNKDTDPETLPTVPKGGYSWRLPGWAHPPRVPAITSFTDDNIPPPELRPMVYDDAVLDLINSQLFKQVVASDDEDTDELNSHQVYMTCKLAAALALAESRDLPTITMDDWELAMKVMAMSDRNRTALQSKAKKIDARDEEKKTFVVAKRENTKTRIQHKLKAETAVNLLSDWKKFFAGRDDVSGRDLSRRSTKVEPDIYQMALELSKSDPDITFIRTQHEGGGRPKERWKFPE